MIPTRSSATTLKSLGMPEEMVMRHRTPQFAHIFSSDAYSAGYYSYLWAEVLDHDAFEAFTDAGGAYDKVVAKRLHDDIMAVGNGVDPRTGIQEFSRRRSQDRRAVEGARIRAAAAPARAARAQAEGG